MNYQIIQGHAPEILRTLPDESVHCVVTSPPYFSLRDYKLPPLIWGGRSDCEHEWGKEIQRTHEGGGNSGVPEEWQRPSRGAHTGGSSGAFCSLCNAWKGSLGLEPTIELWAEHLTWIFRELRRVLRSDGTLWLEIGYSWDGRGNLVDQPTILRNALVKDGWYCKAPIVWHHTNAMPESVTKRPTKAHSIVWLLAKDKATKYFYDQEAIKEPAKRVGDIPGGHYRTKQARPDFRHSSFDTSLDTTPVPSGRNKRMVWTIPTQPLSLPHFASFPEALVEPCILAGTSLMGCCPECGVPWERVVERKKAPLTRPRPFSKPGNEGNRDDVGRIYEESVTDTLGWRPTCSHPHTEADTVPCVVLDPFAGSGTVGVVALKHGRKFIGIELSEEYIEMAHERISAVAPLFGGV